MVAALAVGRSRIEGLNDGTDVAATADALGAFGARIAIEPGGVCSVAGVGAGGLLQPERALDMGNSGTSARLLAGLAASHPVIATFIGDASLSRRPMERVAAPLRRLGARIATATGGTLPMRIEGTATAVPRVHELSLPSAQIKSALLLAALNTPGITRVVELAPTRDHLERLLKLFGAQIEVEGKAIAVRGEAKLLPQEIRVAGDFSAAALLAVAVLVTPGSEVRLNGVGVNPRRTGLAEVLEAMGGDVRFENRREVSGEPVADLTIRHSALTGFDVPPEIAPRMIDEFPVLFVAAAFASGRTRTRGLAELRLKEADRLSAMAAGLRAIGARVEEHEDGLTIDGSGGEPLAGAATVVARGDHRVAMSLAVAGLHCSQPVMVDDMAAIDTSFPGFAAALDALAPA
jgi:3-phosphoshikimate 1-carboxyvinyltransferase